MKSQNQVWVSKFIFSYKQTYKSDLRGPRFDRNCIFSFFITDYWLWQLTQPITRQTVQKWFIMKIGLGGGTEHGAVQCTLWILLVPWIHEHHDTRVACTQKDPRYFPRFGFELTMVEKEARKMVQVAGAPLWRLRNKFHVFALNCYQSALTLLLPYNSYLLVQSIDNFLMICQWHDHTLAKYLPPVQTIQLYQILFWCLLGSDLEVHFS